MKPIVRAFNPTTLNQAIEIARHQEEAIQALKTPPDKSPKPYSSWSRPTLPPPTPQNSTYTKPSYNLKPILPTPAPQTKLPSTSNLAPKPKVPAIGWQKPTRYIPAVERAEKIAKGLYYYCDQLFERGHKCGSKGK